jgi:hypothetical protein
VNAYQSETNSVIRHGGREPARDRLEGFQRAEMMVLQRVDRVP